MNRSEAELLIEEMDAIEARCRAVERSLTRIRRRLQDAHRIKTWDYDPNTKNAPVGAPEDGK